ncbi:MAG: hypothetical protein J6P05_05085 [Lachnospiraceae bacterium]|nr:hypothetical protein [Lachnospiraceae bacterium]
MSDILAALFVTVVGGIIVHYAVKWIDRWLDERVTSSISLSKKGKKQPLGRSTSRGVL